MNEPTIDSLRRALVSHTARIATPRGQPSASVALIVRPGPADMELLLIKRSVRQGDPWSGHMALPGGRHDPADSSAAATAIRETWEEVGIDLRSADRRLGRLDDVEPGSAKLAIVVSPFVFCVPQRTTTTINEEVERAYWVGCRRLAAPEATTEYLHALESGEQVSFPAIGYEDDVIWGLTYRIIRQFIEIAFGTPDTGAG